ncbi:MAG: chorismate mutase, partial [Clostridia bacterium]|nr:chorismate mutase [Clostridia bacterium]
MELNEIRNKIDGLDDEIIKLYLKRMELVKEVAASKAKSGKTVADDSREREIIFRLSKKAPEELKMFVKELYETVFFTSRAYQSTLLNGTSKTVEALKALIEKGFEKLPVSATVACQGVKGAFSGVAAQKFFPVSDIVYVKNFEGVFGAVESGLCEYGV